MKINELQDLLKDKRVDEEIHKYLWIESQKLGYSIGIDQAIEQWLEQHGLNWMRYHLAESYADFMHRRNSHNKAKKKVSKSRKVEVLGKKSKGSKGK